MDLIRKYYMHQPRWSQVFFVLIFFIIYSVNQAYAKGKLEIKSIIESDLPVNIYQWLKVIAEESELSLTDINTLDEIQNYAKDTEAQLLKGLHAKGYYAAKIRSDVEKKKNNKVIVVFQIKSGDMFVLSSFRIKDDNKNVKYLDLNSLGLKIGHPFEAISVLEAEKKLNTQVESLNCLAAIEISHQAILNYKNHSAELIFFIKKSEQSKFGSVSFKGITSVQAQFLRKKIKFRQGDCFKPSHLEKLRSDFLATKLFGKVEVNYEKATNEYGEIPVTFIFTERLHKTIKLGLGYGSDEGMGVSSSWEHRNLLGTSEILKFDASVNKLKQLLESTFTEPYFRRDDQSLVLSNKIMQENAAAYDALSFEIKGVIKRKLKHNWIVSVGSGYSVSGVTSNENQNFGLLSFPFGVSQDKRNDLLDPTKGHRVNLEWTAFFDTFQPDIIFYKTHFEGTHYNGFNGPLSPIIAIRLAIGSIVGAALLTIPADERFYTGGSNSVRGFGYQKLGVLSSGTPTGGRSFIETSSELRFKFSEKFGSVLFIDGGNAYQDKYPNLSDPMRWAVGTGIRYYTSFGPIRFDVAFPLHKRKNIDNTYEFYISLGQAF